MKIIDENGIEITDPDLSLGYLEGKVIVKHHEAIQGVEEQWHYETVAEYPNGGRDVRRVIDVQGIEGRDAWEEEILIQIYHPFTAEELAQRAQEAARPTIEERMERMEAAIAEFKEVHEAAAKRWADLLAAGGEE